MDFTAEEVIGALKNVRHPAVGKNIVELNMVSDISIAGVGVAVTLTFAKAHDPMKNSIVKACEKVLRSYLHPDVEPDIAVKIMPPPATSQQAEKIRPPAKNIIAVASGKGGVGKSTVAANVAVAVAKMGQRVGLLDADIYGPSIPKMLGAEDARPEIVDGKIIPIERYGIRILSIGFFVRPQDAIIWRGPRATSAIRQMLAQCRWGDLDYLIIDMPPGTGDVHLTIVQELPVTGAVIVSTPQEVALADAIKGIDMFQTENVNVPILGLVENMAWFTPAELPDNRYYIFGNGGCKALAEQKGIRLLGQIPIVQGICEGGDSGQPVAENESSITGKAFMQLAQSLIDATNNVNFCNYQHHTA